ncbi:MAG: hypothetical protein HGA78_06115 [Nitrospirales bacterium]|nr:hypothetical protein [Nitrospirales bacterium]
MQTEIIVAGFGGQGVLFAGQLLAYAGMDEGKNVTWIPSYGPEMRGGTANCTVVVSDEEIGSPLVRNPSAVIAMNRPSLDKYEDTIQSGGYLVINESMLNRKPTRKDIHVITIPGNDIAEELGDKRMTNMVLLGGLLANLKVNAPKFEGMPEDQWDDLDSEKTVTALVNAITAGGNYCEFLEGDITLYDTIRKFQPDICFNICEGHFGDAREAQVPAMLEMLSMPYTGSKVMTLALALDKSMTKRVFNFNPGPASLPQSVLEIARDVEAIDSPQSLVASQESGIVPEEKVPPHPSPLTSSVRIGVIRDRAFQFYYPENFEELRKQGAEIIEVNALKDERLPDIDCLYIGGGFPETNALLLAENEGFRRSVKEAAESGLPIYAECGGLMFLGDSIIVKGERFPMVGVFPLVFEMGEKPHAHGYTIVEADRENPFYPVGTVLKGHEFHYSAVVDGLPSLDEGEQGRAGFAFLMKRGQGIAGKRDGIFYKNAFASYTHLHALGAEPWVEGMIRKAKEYKEHREARAL